MMSLGFHFFHDVLQFSIWANEKRHAIDTHVLTSHKLLQTPHAVLIGNSVIFIRQKVKIQIFFLAKLE